MRYMIVVSVLALASACAKEPTAPPAKVEAKPAVKAEAKPEADAKPAEKVAGEAVAFDQTNAKIGFVGAKVTGSHVGGFNEFAGVVTLVDGQADKGAVEVTIKTGSLFVDNEKLDGHLRSADFFDVEKIPEAKFASSSITKGDAGYTVVGDLTLHGVTKQITFPAQITVDAAKVAVNSEFTINRKDFGIVYPGMPDDLIRDAVELKLSVEAPRAAPTDAAPTAAAEAEAAPTAAVPQ